MVKLGICKSREEVAAREGQKAKGGLEGPAIQKEPRVGSVLGRSSNMKALE